MDTIKTLDSGEDYPNSTEVEQPNLSSKILLEETFYVLTKKHCVFRVRLTRAGLCLLKETQHESTTDTIKEQRIPIEDIIGCRCLRSRKRSGKKNSCAAYCQSGHNSCTKNNNNSNVVEEDEDECSYSETVVDNTDISAYLYIYAYVLQHNNHKNKGANKNRRRERTVITLRFRSFDKYEENFREAQKWRTIIKKLIKGEPLNHIASHIYDFSMALNKYKECRRLLVLCNPKSGPGRGKTIFQQKVVPVLQEAEIPYDLHITKHANFAREFIRSCNIFQWSAIILVGGDGIVFEAINGLFERWDWLEVLRSVPLGVVPGGSGNGLARSIAHHSGEPYAPSAPALPAALACVKNRTTAMDLVRVETRSQIMFSFLSVGWGLLSDIDIESERLRMLGGQRFTVWSVARLIGLRSYGGKLWYLPADDVPSSQSKQQPQHIKTVYTSLSSPSSGNINNNNNNNNCDSKTNFASSSLQDLSDGGGGGRTAVPGSSDELLVLQTEASKASSAGGRGDGEGEGARQRLDSWYSAASRRSAYFSATADSSYQSTADSMDGCGIAGDMTGGGAESSGDNNLSSDTRKKKKCRMYGPASRLPCLTQPLQATMTSSATTSSGGGISDAQSQPTSSSSSSSPPSCWKCIEGRFVMVHASYQTHLGEDCLFAPDAKLNDGNIWLLIVHGGASRVQLLNFLLGLSTGAHIQQLNNGGAIELIAVHAFRIEPDPDENGYMTVDGERVEYGPIQAEIFPSLCKVMVP